MFCSGNWISVAEEVRSFFGNRKKSEEY